MYELAVNKELQSYGLELIRPYVDRDTKLVYICVCGGIGQTRLCHIRAGTYCGHCTENNYRTEFLQAGCEIISYNRCTAITYRCNCGNILTRQASHWRNNPTCPNCRVAWNWKEDKIPCRPSLNSWKRQVLDRDGYVCINCNSIEKLCAHHIEAYSAAPELAAVVTNGATLCLTCHTDLHRQYGWNVGRLNLELALGKSLTTSSRSTYECVYPITRRLGV